MRCIPCVGELSLCVECTAPMASTTTTGAITYDHYRMPEGAKFCHWTYSQISKFYKKKKTCTKTGNVSISKQYKCLKNMIQRLVK